MCTCFQILLNAWFILIIASNCDLLGYDAMKFYGWASVFQRDMLLPSSVDRGRMSETLAPLYQTTQCHNPEDCNRFQVSRPFENLKSCNKIMSWKFKSCGMTSPYIYRPFGGACCLHLQGLCSPRIFWSAGLVTVRRKSKYQRYFGPGRI
jgi:hypothetical protein